MVYRMGMVQEMGQYPSEKLLDGDRQNVHLKEPLTPEMHSAILRSRTHQFNLGYPVEAENVPTTWQWASSRPLPDYYTPEGFSCVSPLLKEIIERYEPDVHQFFPLKVVNKQKEQIAEHYLWVVCNRIDSVDRGHTTMILFNNTIWTSEYKDGDKWVKIPNVKVAFNCAQTDGYHFWRDKHLQGSVIYASDEAAQTMLDAGLTALSLNYEETV